MSDVREGDNILAWSYPSPRLHLGTVTWAQGDLMTVRLQCERKATAPLPKAPWRVDSNVCKRCVKAAGITGAAA